MQCASLALDQQLTAMLRKRVERTVAKLTSEINQTECSQTNQSLDEMMSLQHREVGAAPPTGPSLAHGPKMSGQDLLRILVATDIHLGYGEPPTGLEELKARVGKEHSTHHNDCWKRTVTHSITRPLAHTHAIICCKTTPLYTTVGAFALFPPLRGEVS